MHRDYMQVLFLGPKLFRKFLSLKFLSSAPPSRGLCLVRAHDSKLTKKAEKAQKDLAEAILEAEKKMQIELPKLIVIDNGKRRCLIIYLTFLGLHWPICKIQAAPLPAS